MSRLRSSATAILAAATVAATAASATAAPATTTDDAADAALVKAFVAFDRDVTDADLATLTGLGVLRGFEIETIDAVAVTAPAAVLDAVRELPEVTAVRPQRRIELHLDASVEQIGARGVDQADTYTTGSGATETVFTRPGVTGEGVTVGIIDTGIFLHPDLDDRVTLGLNFEFSELNDEGVLTTEQLDTYAETTGESAFVDEIGHGTHVAGTVGGDGTASTDRDLRGVAPGVDLVALRIASGVNGLLDDVGFEENAVAAIDYLIRHPETGVKLTNNSWGLLETEPSTVPGEETDFDAAKAVTRAAVDAGITMVFSAGNDGPEPGTIGEDPGGIEEVITVAAACKDAEGTGCEAPGITDFSSRGPADGTGPQVDISAPGDQILAAASPSVIAGLNQCRTDSGPLYYCISGTSMAAPHIAGVVALMQEVNPELTPAQAEECLTTTATDLLEPGVDIHSGHGMVDTVQALRCSHELTATGTTTPAGDTVPAGAPTPTTTAAPASLPATGGGAVLLGLLSIAGAAGLRRRG